ncbi:MAG: exodeoxyribonuclease VII large subunit, partial [Kiritimatiellae bacterium]|nr:exodeoxyribonuclease VII large subunit [Kiritimatiellia bacterium]
MAERISSLMRANLSHVCVEGEISGFKPYSTGSAYFTLKDEAAQVSAVWFAYQTLKPGLTFEVKDGLKVRITGRIDIYGKNGQCRLIVNKLETAGVGDLMQRFLELKERLTREGLFAPERKRPLPFLPQRIAVVTSPTGAVIHDILNVLGRRFPNVQVRLAPVKVQGDDAARQIAHAIEVVNRIYAAGSAWPADLLIVGRGGGSLEDLWPFNEEVVARAVAASVIPVISAVGHETDFTLCDFAADKRAPTPSAAAELAVPLKSELETR